MRYAMILQNKVIGVLDNQETEPYWPPDPAGNPVIAIPCDDTVFLGMIYDTETGTFSEYIPPEPTPEPTPEPEPDPVIEKLSNIETALNTLTADSITVSSVKAAISEGVNDI